VIDKFDEDWKAYTKIRDALQDVAESEIDTGGGLGTRDFWVRINGVEWVISMRRSDRQLAIDASLEQEDKP
jgi:hypothetical protein